LDDESTQLLAQLIRTQRVASLGTLRDGSPFVSMVLYAPAEDFRTYYIHTSRLAYHTQDILRDPRVSLMIAEADDGTRDPQTLARVSILGSAGIVSEEEADYANRKGFSKHAPALPLYTEADARRCLRRLAPVDFDVPGFTEERLSTPILSDQLLSPGALGSGGGTARRVMPVVRRSFQATSTLHGWIELYGAARDTGTGEPKATARFAARSADGREWAGGTATPMSLETGTPTRLVSIPLSDAPEGESEFVLTVRDKVSGRTLEAREPFRVEPRAAAPTAGEGQTDPPGGRP